MIRSKSFVASLAIALLCALALADQTYRVSSQSTTSPAPANPPFDFNRFTKGRPFRLNTLPTTKYGPAWADVIAQPSNMVACHGAPIALCYYSGPGPTTPCILDGLGIANCTCYEIPAEHPYLVDINAILNMNVYLETVRKCGKQGELCKPTGSIEAPVCEAINRGVLIPGADLVSTFSLYLQKTDSANFGISLTNCDSGQYAGCMTAPCKRTGKTDANTNLPLVQCACPTYTGQFQVGTSTTQCALSGNYVWSAAYNPKLDR